MRFKSVIRSKGMRSDISLLVKIKQTIFLQSHYKFTLASSVLRPVHMKGNCLMGTGHLLYNTVTISSAHIDSTQAYLS